MNYKYSRILSILVLIVLFSSCSPYFYQPLGDRNARLGPETQMKSELLSLPEPETPIYVAVYKFRDQTGQYKESNVGASWSTAVTQGATNILIRALEESGWFIPIERENISNLLNERKIIRSSREQYENAGEVLLPPLLFAGVLLEGGIVSYETNIYTGGAGLRYFGADASTQYREDRVSIYLRAISTNNGQILKTVYTTKSILSQEVSAGLFRYVKFKRLLEAETGYTYNEPTEMAIIEAVEKAVHSLVLEGMVDNLWKSSESDSSTQETIDKYLSEKDQNVKTDYIGRPYENEKRSKSFISVLASGQTYVGDYSSSLFSPGFSVNFGREMMKGLFIQGGVGFQQMNIKNLLNSNDYFGVFGLSYFPNQTGKFSPFISTSIGGYYDFGNTVAASNKKILPFAKYELGLEMMLTNKTSITTNAFANQMLTDRYDGSVEGTYNDVIWGINFGLRFYLGK